MLATVKEYNQLSDQLRKQLREERERLGRYVKFKFYIARKNPDGEQRAAGEYIYPALYTLTPVTFQIIDPGDKLPKLIGLAEQTTRYGQIEEVKLRRIEVTERQAGIVTYDQTVLEHVQNIEYILLHLKLEGGMFRDKNIPAMVARVDELKEAKGRVKERELRVMALSVAARMGEKEVRDFAAAMNWNELEDLDIIRDKITSLAEKDPEFFRKFIDDPTIEYKAILRRAMDANIVGWLPTENKFIWQSNGSTIAMLERVEGDAYFDRMAEWFMLSKNGPETYKKMKSLLGTPVTK